MPTRYLRFVQLVKLIAIAVKKIQLGVIAYIKRGKLIILTVKFCQPGVLAQIQRRSRKYNTGTIIITQQPTDFAAPNVITHGKAIFDNAAYYLVMGLKKQAVEDLALLVDLNDNEKESIKRYNQGEALFICGSRRMRINIIATEQELDSFGTGGGL